MRLLRMIHHWHNAKLRHIDIQILWPEIKKQTSNIDEARNAFELHALDDPAWQDMSEAEIYRVIENLT